VVVNLAVLAALLARQVGFVEAQTAAILTAMTSNYFLNNAFTYRDRRLHGSWFIGRTHFFRVVVQFGRYRRRGRLNSPLSNRRVMVACRHRGRSNRSTVELCRELSHHMARTMKFAACRWSSQPIRASSHLGVATDRTPLKAWQGRGT